MGNLSDGMNSNVDYPDCESDDSNFDPLETDMPDLDLIQDNYYHNLDNIIKGRIAPPTDQLLG